MPDRQSQIVVGVKAFTGLLSEFRKGNIANKKVFAQSLKQHISQLTQRWNRQFPGYPQSRHPRLAFAGFIFKEPRDAHLKKIIIEHLTSDRQNHGDRIIVNPACFLGRRARHLASHLRSFRVIAADINPRFNALYKYLCRTPDNYEFRQDSIFDPKLKVNPSAVVFFGACGSLTDAAMDYMIRSNSPYLFCRTCCQHVIGQNIDTAKNFGLVSWLWGFQKPMLVWILKKRKGHYFSPAYSMDQYPRSQAAKALTDSDDFWAFSRYAAGSGICRTLIDLDRYLYLAEHGYDVWYRADMFIAKKIAEKQMQ